MHVAPSCTTPVPLWTDKRDDQVHALSIDICNPPPPPCMWLPHALHRYPFGRTGGTTKYMLKSAKVQRRNPLAFDS